MKKNKTDQHKSPCKLTACKGFSFSHYSHHTTSQQTAHHQQHRAAAHQPAPHHHPTSTSHKHHQPAHRPHPNTPHPAEHQRTAPPPGRPPRRRSPAERPPAPPAQLLNARALYRRAVITKRACTHPRPPVRGRYCARVHLALRVRERKSWVGMRAFFHFPLGRAEKVEGGQKIKLGRNEGRGAGLVTGMGEPGRVLLGAACRGCAGMGKSGWCCPARRGGGQKNKGKHIFVQAFFNPAYRR